MNPLVLPNVILYLHTISINPEFDLQSLNEGSNILVKGEEYRLSWHPRQYMGQNSVDTELLDSNGPGINNEGTVATVHHPGLQFHSLVCH